VRLFHFSDDPNITHFEPRTPPHRPGVEPLVWAVDEANQATYLFPRECPRILLWPTPETTAEDRAAWWGDRPDTPLIAHVEWDWYERLRTQTLYRYELPPETFQPLKDDTWMWVSRTAVEPLAMEPIPDIMTAMADAGVELRLMRSLAPLWGAWESTVHFSGIRLRNSKTWPETAPPPPVEIRSQNPQQNF
jgi:hypothetical protein